MPLYTEEEVEEKVKEAVDREEESITNIVLARLKEMPTVSYKAYRVLRDGNTVQDAQKPKNYTAHLKEYTRFLITTDDLFILNKELITYLIDNIIDFESISGELYGDYCNIKYK